MSTEPTPVHGWANQLERAVSNLLANADKFSPPDAPIEVVLAERTVVVSDHGSGIAAADRPFVFDRFFRSPSARSQPGSGLGLAIVRQIAEQHGGTVSVGSSVDGGAAVGFSVGS